MGVVLAPSDGTDIPSLAKAGAKEIYVGYADPQWKARFPGLPSPNRLSGFGNTANALTFTELLAQLGELPDQLHKHAHKQTGAVSFDDRSDSYATEIETTEFAQESTQKTRVQRLEDRAGTPHLGNKTVITPDVYITCNTAAYTDAQRAFFAHERFPALAKVGVKGIITSDVQLIGAVHACGMTAVASTMCGIYNADIAQFYRNSGIDRAVLPRHLSLREIEAITREVPDLRFEAFLMRNGCIFSDARCLGVHKDSAPSICRALRDAEFWEVPLSGHIAQDELHKRGTDSEIFHERFHVSTCGLCALWHLEQAGVDAYKIVGRCDATSDIRADIALVAENIRRAAACKSEEEYLSSMHRPKDLLTLCENDGLSCYYPEVRF